MRGRIAGGERLSERAENHCEDVGEGPMKPADRICQAPRMLGDGGSDPGMGKLEQQRATRPQKYDRLPINPPGNRGRAEQPCRATCRVMANPFELAVEVGLCNDVERCQGHRRLIPVHSVGCDETSFPCCSPAIPLRVPLQFRCSAE